MKKLICILAVIILIAFIIFQISMSDCCVAPNADNLNFKNPFDEFLSKAEKEIKKTKKKISTLPSATYFRLYA